MLQSFGVSKVHNNCFWELRTLYSHIFITTVEIRICKRNETIESVEHECQHVPETCQVHFPMVPQNTQVNKGNHRNSVFFMKPIIWGNVGFFEGSRRNLSQCMKQKNEQIHAINMPTKNFELFV